MNKWMIFGLALVALAVLYFVFLRGPDRLADGSNSVPHSGQLKPSPSATGEGSIRQVKPEVIVAELDPAKREEIQNALDHGRKIDAIMMLREAATIDLKDAKTVVEYMQQKQH